MKVNTTTPGEDGQINNPLGNQPIKIFPWKLERDISQIVCRNSTRVDDKDHETVRVISDTSALVVELMEYIIEKENAKNKKTG